MVGVACDTHGMQAPVADAKRALRVEMRAMRRRIAADPVDRLARSSRIWARIVSLADLGAHRLDVETERPRTARVMLFDALASEPETAEWICWCHDRGISVYLPAVDGSELRVQPGDLDPAELDVVVVPGLAFTADGQRLGQGGGHYDRFLIRLRPACVTIGAAFAEQLVDDLPTDPHDVRLTHVATDA